MKKLLFLLLAVTSMQLTFAQSDKYVSVMKTNLALFDSSQTDNIVLSNIFVRIGDVEKTQWLPYYYAGLALCTEGQKSTTIDKDANSGQILALMDKAQALTIDSIALSEINTIRNMAYVQQLLVDPGTRYMTYGKKANDALSLAIQLNPKNPRPYYLEGMGLFSKPPTFGGGKDKAKIYFKKAAELYLIDHPKNLYPNWGQQQTTYMLAKCNE